MQSLDLGGFVVNYSAHDHVASQYVDLTMLTERRRACASDSGPSFRRGARRPIGADVHWLPRTCEAGAAMRLIESILADAAIATRATRHPRPPRAVLRGAAHRRRDRQGAHRLGHPDPPRHGQDRRRRHRQERQLQARRGPARRHRRAADDRGTTRFAHAQPARRQDARVRPRRPHRDAAGGGQASEQAPQLRRHRATWCSSRPKKAAAARAR